MVKCRGFQYNRKSKETIPYLKYANSEIPLETPLYITYAYDYMGRLQRIEYPDEEHSTENIKYFPSNNSYFESFTDKSGKVHEIVHDTRGRIIQKREPLGNIILYSYNKAGLLTLITNTDGLPTYINYDSLGRKTSITDPNVGTTTYSYNDAGSLIMSHDAKGNTVSYEYDV